MPVATPARLPIRLLLALAGLLGVAGFLLAWPSADPLLRAASVVTLSIALWATGWLPQWLTALVFFTLCTVAGVASADTVFAGFASAATFGLLGGMAMALGMLVTLPGVPAVLTPLAPEMATMTGWSPEAITMSQVVGFSTVLLPYQAPPLVVGLISAGMRLRDAMRVLLIVAAISLVLLWPLDYLWWQLLGWI